MAKVVGFVVVSFDSEEYNYADGKPMVNPTAEEMNTIIQEMVDSKADWPDDVSIVVKLV